MSTTTFDFEVLIDDMFVNINTDSSLSVIDNKKVLSIINDFEDGKWRDKKFQKFIWDNIAESALSLRERQALIGQPLSILSEAAKKLRLTDRDTTGQGSELAEIILYGLMRHYYKALPVVPKIFYKQNVNDNAKGADSVHIVIEGSNNFSIWFGEAKFYNSIEDERLYEIINSVENSLHIDKLKKEYSIITNLPDLDECLSDNKDLCVEIKSLLSSKSSIDLIKPKLHIPILLLHECKITAEHNELTDEYKNKIIEFHKGRAESYFKKQINKLNKNIHNYSKIHFHIILFPVPEKGSIVDSFVANVGYLKNQ